MLLLIYLFSSRKRTWCQLNSWSSRGSFPPRFPRPVHSTFISRFLNLRSLTQCCISFSKHHTHLTLQKASISPYCPACCKSHTAPSVYSAAWISTRRDWRSHITPIHLSFHWFRLTLRLIHLTEGDKGWPGLCKKGSLVLEFSAL